MFLTHPVCGSFGQPSKLIQVQTLETFRKTAHIRPQDGSTGDTTAAGQGTDHTNCTDNSEHGTLPLLSQEV